MNGGRHFRCTDCEGYLSGNRSRLALRCDEVANFEAKIGSDPNYCPFCGYETVRPT